MEPPDTIEGDRRRADYYISLTLDGIVVTGASRHGQLDRCRASDRVERVYRKPLYSWRRSDAVPRLGEPFSVRVPCWNETARDEPPGPNRLHYGGPTVVRQIQVWGTVIDGEFVVYQLAETG